LTLKSSKLHLLLIATLAIASPVLSENVTDTWPLLQIERTVDFPTNSQAFFDELTTTTHTHQFQAIAHSVILNASTVSYSIFRLKASNYLIFCLSKPFLFVFSGQSPPVA